MSEAVSPYFSKCGTKRNYPSTSEESDNSICSEASASSRQERKRLNAVVSEDDTDMAVQAALDKISQRLDILATRTDVDQIKVEVKNLTQTFIEKLEKLEGRLFDTETKTDKIEAEVKAEKKKTEILTDTVKQQERRLRQLEREQNDLQQYTRRWNLRVYKVPEDKAESADDCVSKVCGIFSDKVGVPVNAADIEVAHRVGQRSSTGSRPIIVRFFDRKKRDEVLRNRRNLKRKVFVVGEDLTYANYQVSKKAMEHSATLAVWSSNGRILAKVKNGRIVRLNIHTDLDKVFKRAMYSNAMSADEDN